MALAVGPAPSPAVAAIPPEDLAERAERASATARAVAGNPSPEAMQRVREALGLPEVVSLPSGDVLIPADPFLAELDGEDASDFAAAARHLDALGAEVRSSADVGAIDERELRGDLAEAYEGIEPDRGFLARVGRFLLTLMGRLFRWLLRSAEFLGGGNGVLGWLVLLTLVAAGVWGLTRLGRRRVPEAVVVEEGAVRDPTDWRRRAEEAMARGDTALAVVYLYRSLVAALARRGLVEDRPSLTAGEVRRALRGGSAAVALVDATRRYERVRYGLAPVTSEDLDALRQAERTARAA